MSHNLISQDIMSDIFGFWFWRYFDDII